MGSPDTHAWSFVLPKCSAKILISHDALFATSPSYSLSKRLGIYSASNPCEIFFPSLPCSKTEFKKFTISLIPLVDHIQNLTTSSVLKPKSFMAGDI